MTLALVYSTIYLEHDPLNYHPENSERLRAIVKRLKEDGIWDRALHPEPRRAEKEDILAVHSEEHYENIKAYSERGAGYIDPDTYYNGMSFEAALTAAGGVMTAVDTVKEKDADRAFALVRPPGHHAYRNRAMGFCLFNNIAVGAKYARRNGFKKALILDWDVHHGNGTQQAFYGDDSIAFLSVHQFPHFPGTGFVSERGEGPGSGLNINFPLPAGAGDDEINRIFSANLPGLMDRFEPDIIFVSAGFDGHKNDPLAGWSMTSAGYAELAGFINRQAGDIPLIAVLEGGYSQEVLSECVSLVCGIFMKSE